MQTKMELTSQEISVAIQAYLAVKGYEINGLYIGFQDGEPRAIASGVKQRDFNPATIFELIKNN
jgi:hypothetical protein